MSRETHGAPLGRCLLVWSLVTTGAGSAPVLLVEDLRRCAGLLVGETAGLPFDAVLVAGCAALLTGCGAWLWAVTTLTVVLAWRGRVARVRGCPDAVRRVVLAACGLALVATAAPATAAPPVRGDPSVGLPPSREPVHVLAGLPYPELPTGPDRTTPPRQAVVRAGDSLWSIARRDLPPGASPGAVERRWRAIWRANRAAVPDPDLIRPGLVLTLPPDEESR